MVDTIKVTMNLTPNDVANTEILKETFQSRSKAQAVSTALEVTQLLSKAAGKNGRILIEHENGDIERLIIPGLHK